MNLLKLNWSLFKVRISKVKWVLAEIRLIKICILGIINIGYPKTENQKKYISDSVRVYDTSIKYIEDEIISKVRQYVK